ncbi:MAG: electron transport complex subunit RsxE [Pseudomonadota bacterium]
MAEKNPWVRGIWTENAATVQLLGLCPLLAVTTKTTYAIGLGIATLLVVTLSNIAVASLRRLLSAPIRIPAYVLIIASLVTSIETIMAAFFPSLYAGLGIFVALIVTNCLIVARAEAFARHHTVVAAAIDGIATGIGFLLAIVAVGMLREAVGSLTLFADLSILVGDVGEPASVGNGLRLALLPPGAFLALAAVIVATRWLSAQHQHRAAAEKPS